MDIWMVSLADRVTGHDQRVLVTVPHTDTEEDVREFVLRPGLTGTKGETIALENPVVIGLRKLPIKRPLRNITMTQVEKAAV